MLFSLLSRFRGHACSSHTSDLAEVLGFLASSSCSLPLLTGRDLGSEVILCIFFLRQDALALVQVEQKRANRGGFSFFNPSH